MHTRRLHKPDGRYLILYGRGAIPPCDAPAPPGGGPVGSHLRWHPLRGEWVIYAGHRQARTFLPPAEHDPLAPTTDPEHPTEVPAGPWDVAVFENRFPALGRADDPPGHIVETAPARGRCEVVVYTQDARGALGALPLWHVELVLEVWADRTTELADRGDVRYVFAFENRGVEVGVTLHHPHGQIYAYPFVPPTAARVLAREKAHHDATGRGLLADHLRGEIEDARRVLYVSPEAISIVPACARWAYECWVAPRRMVPRLSELDEGERRELARALRDALQRLDGLWRRPMPYVLAVFQAPCRGNHRYSHAHIEIYPWLRARDRQKFLAGSETAMGAFTADTMPEDTAAELRAVPVTE